MNIVNNVLALLRMTNEKGYSSPSYNPAYISCMQIYINNKTTHIDIRNHQEKNKITFDHNKPFYATDNELMQFIQDLLTDESTRI